MNLETLVSRVAEGLAFVDRTTKFVSKYLPGVPSLTETQLCKELVEWWAGNHADDFLPPGTCQREIPYPGAKRSKCDIVFRTPDGTTGGEDWAVELKRLQFVGDNGKKNDHHVEKVLSPYLKDRSLIHDILRMRKHPLAKRQVVVGYMFSYSFESCDLAAVRHPGENSRIEAIREVCRTNDRQTGILDPTDLVEFADSLFRREDFVSDHQTQRFSDVWRHPCGGNGMVFGWEVKKDPAVVTLGQDSHQRLGPIELDLGMSS